MCNLYVRVYESTRTSTHTFLFCFFVFLIFLCTIYHYKYNIYKPVICRTKIYLKNSKLLLIFCSWLLIENVKSLCTCVREHTYVFTYIFVLFLVFLYLFILFFSILLCSIYNYKYNFYKHVIYRTKIYLKTISLLISCLVTLCFCFVFFYFHAMQSQMYYLFYFSCFVYSF